MSSQCSNKDLLQQVDEHDLPLIYGGNCQCKAQCIYSEKGPWSEVENYIDYQNPQNNDSDNNSDKDDFNEASGSLFGASKANKFKQEF